MQVKVLAGATEIKTKSSVRQEVNVDHFVFHKQYSHVPISPEQPFRKADIALLRLTTPLKLIRGQVWPTTIVKKNSNIERAGVEAKRCTGSIMNKDTVLTAAQCVQGVPQSELKIIAGVADIRAHSLHNVSEQQREIARIWVHDDFKSVESTWPNPLNPKDVYSAKFHVNDVALLVLKNPLERVADEVWPVIVPDPKAPLDATGAYEATLLGWGLIREDNGSHISSRDLRSVGVSLALPSGSTECVGEEYHEQVLCSQDGERAIPCWGDLGAPAVVLMAAKQPPGMKFNVLVAMATNYDGECDGLQLGWTILTGKPCDVFHTDKPYQQLSRQMVWDRVVLPSLEDHLVCCGTTIPWPHAVAFLDAWEGDRDHRAVLLRDPPAFFEDLSSRMVTFGHWPRSITDRLLREKPCPPGMYWISYDFLYTLVHWEDLLLCVHRVNSDGTVGRLAAYSKWKSDEAVNIGETKLKKGLYVIIAHSLGLVGVVGKKRRAALVVHCERQFTARLIPCAPLMYTDSLIELVARKGRQYACNVRAKTEEGEEKSQGFLFQLEHDKFAGTMVMLENLDPDCHLQAQLDTTNVSNYLYVKSRPADVLASSVPPMHRQLIFIMTPRPGIGYLDPEEEAEGPRKSNKKKHKLIERHCR
ncbi:unnamed protein product, partial [Mesorhabditis spiculigera]